MNRSVLERLLRLALIPALISFQMPPIQAFDPVRGHLTVTVLPHGHGQMYEPGVEVTLTASASGPVNSWNLVSGPELTVSSTVYDNQTINISFTAPSVAIRTKFSFIVHANNATADGSAQVMFDVEPNPKNIPPFTTLAVVMPQTVPYVSGTHDAPGDVGRTTSNNQPTATGQSLSTPVDTPLTVTSSASDADAGDTLTTQIYLNPSHGTLGAVAGNQVTYTPDSGYTGTDSFILLPEDNGGAANGTMDGMVLEFVNIVVGNNSNQPPVLTEQSLTTAFQTPLNYSLIYSDPDTPAASLVVMLIPPLYGTLQVNGSLPNVAYTPGGNYAGGEKGGTCVSDGVNFVCGSDNLTVQDPGVTVAEAFVGDPDAGGLFHGNLTLGYGSQTHPFDTTNTSFFPIDGPYDLYFQAQDQSGATSKSYSRVIVDNTPPTCTYKSPLTPAEGDWVAGNISFTVEATDSAGVRGVTLQDPDTASISPYLPVNGTSNWQYTNFATQSLSNGSHAFTSNCYDSVSTPGNVAVITRNLNIDNADPTGVITLTPPAVSHNGDQLVRGEETITVTGDDGSGSGVASINLALDGTSIASSSSNPLSTVLNTDIEGDHRLTATITDVLGNEGTVSLMLKFDKTPPSISIASPTEGEIITGGLSQIQAAVSDLNGIAGQTILIDGANLSFTQSGDTYTLNPAFSAAAGVYTIVLQATDVVGNSNQATRLFVVPVENQAPMVSAGMSQTITLPSVASLSGSASDDGLPNPPAAITTTWSKVSGPGSVVFADANAPSTTAIFSLAGIYVLRLTASDSQLSTISEVSLTVNELGGTGGNQSPAVSAGSNQTITRPSAANLSGSASDDGLPNPPGALTTTWSKVSGPGSVTFGDANALGTTADFSSAGTYVLRLTASDSQLSATSDVTITVNVAGGTGGNQTPTVSAGSDQTITLPSSANLSGSASDDGLPNPLGALTTTWSKVSGPGSVTFGNASALNTTADFSSAGTYILQLKADDSQLSATSDVMITVDPPVLGNQPPQASAGADQTITLPSSANLSGNASDDGLPDQPGALTTTWSKVSGLGGVTFGNASALNTTADFSSAGTYVLRLTVSDSQLSATSDVTVTVNVTGGTGGNQTPLMSAGSDQTITLPSSANLSGNASDDGLPNPPAEITKTWSKVSGPGSVIFGNANALNTTASFSSAGTYVLRLTVSDSQLSVMGDVTIAVNVPGGTGGNQTPTVSVGADQTVKLPSTATLLGSASDDGLPNSPGALTTTWSKVSGPGSVTFGNANAPSTTASFSTSGTYVLRLTASDGQLSASRDMTITVNPAATPVVQFLAPLNGDSIKGRFIVKVFASDDVAVASVVFRINGGANQTGTAGPGGVYTLDLDTSSLPSASTTIQVTASDGSLTATASITVMVDNQSPTVTSFSLVDGSTISGPVVVQGSGSDNKGISNLGLYVDGVLVTSVQLGGATSGSINYSLNTTTTLTNGNHSIQVTVTDLAGNVNTQTSIITVQNSLVTEPLPQITILTLTDASAISGITRLQMLVPGTVSVAGFKIDGGVFIPADNTAPGEYSFNLDTTQPPYVEGHHTIDFIATNEAGSVFKTINVFIDNTPPTLTVSQPTLNAVWFLVKNIIANASDSSGLPLAFVRFNINASPLAFAPGNTDPNNTLYTYALDTEAGDANGNRIYVDGQDYVLTVIAQDQAGNQTIVSVSFKIDNRNIPLSNAIVTWDPTGFFAVGPVESAVSAAITNASVDPSAVSDNSLKIYITKDGEVNKHWAGPVVLVANTLKFLGTIPYNCRVHCSLRTLDTQGNLIQGTKDFISAMDHMLGGKVTFLPEGVLTLNVPSGALKNDALVEIAKMDQNAEVFLDAERSSVGFLNQNLETVYGPVLVTETMADLSQRIDLEAPCQMLFQRPQQSIPPDQQSSYIDEAEQLVDRGGKTIWVPIANSVGASVNNSAIGARTINVSLQQLGTFRVITFAVPGSGITEFFNFPNPTSPAEGGTDLSYLLGDNSDVNLVIYDLLGNLVRRMDIAAGNPGGKVAQNVVHWDLKNGVGEVVGNGGYIVQITAKDSQGKVTRARRKVGVAK